MNTKLGIPPEGRGRLTETAAMKPRCCNAPPRAFVRGDILALLGGMTLLLLVAVPLLAVSPNRSEQMICFNNLRRIGQAFHMWGSDHFDNRPWFVPVASGGTRPLNGTKVGNAWVEFASIANELMTPKILACPSDAETRRVANDFSNRPDGGYCNFSYRANATSYLIGLDTFAEIANNVLCADRNIRVDFIHSRCVTGVNNAATILDRDLFNNAGWTNAVHGLQGNFLFNDGAVRMADRNQFRQVWQTVDDNGSSHMLMPK